MRRVVMTAFALCLAAGCDQAGAGPRAESMIGKTVLVSAGQGADPKFPDRILAVSPDRDPEVFTVMPKYLPAFRAIVIDEVPDIKTAEGTYPARWILRPEETDYAGVVIGVWKKTAKLTVLK